MYVNGNEEVVLVLLTFIRRELGTEDAPNPDLISNSKLLFFISFVLDN